MSNTTTIRFHEFADLFPMMPEMDLMRLAEDIKEKGQSDPIILFEEKILDGRNRYRACEVNNIAPRFEEYTGTDPLGFVISHNLHRRHLTEPQRSMIADKLSNLKHGGQGGTLVNSGIPLLKVTQTKAAGMLNVSLDSVKQARKISKGVPELSEAVSNGGVSLAAAADVSTLPKDEQSAVVAKGKAAIKDAAKAIREMAKAQEPEPEPEPLVVDGTSDEPTKRTRLPKFVPDDADRLWLLAKIDLDKILPTDKSRERVLAEVVKYAQSRIQSNK